MRVHAIDLQYSNVNVSVEMKFSKEKLTSVKTKDVMWSGDAVYPPGGSIGKLFLISLATNYITVVDAAWSWTKCTMWNTKWNTGVTVQIIKIFNKINMTKYMLLYISKCDWNGAVPTSQTVIYCCTRRSKTWHIWSADILNISNKNPCVDGGFFNHNLRVNKT